MQSKLQHIDELVRNTEQSRKYQRERERERQLERERVSEEKLKHFIEEKMLGLQSALLEVYVQIIFVIHQGKSIIFAIVRYSIVDHSRFPINHKDFIDFNCRLCFLSVVAVSDQETINDI